jgi:glutathione S-transferase
MSYTKSPQLPESHTKFANDGEPKLHLLTKGTPNGLKVHALLEELREAYPENSKLAYDFVDIQFDKKEQKSPEFLEVNPNGRIPALVDDNVKDPATGKGHNVFESASILIWLVEKYDTDNKFWFKDEILRSKAFSWIFFGHGGKSSSSSPHCYMLINRCRTHARTSQPFLVSNQSLSRLT